MILKIFIVFLCTTLTMSHYSKEAPTMCYAPNCFDATDYIRSGLDESVDPCDDFYAFTCNNYIKQKLPEGHTVYNDFIAMSNDQSNKLTTFLNELTSSKSKPAELVYRLHDGCVKSYRNMNLALDKAKEVFEEFGGWIAAKEGDLPTVDWTEIAFKLSAIGFNANIFLPLSITDRQKYALQLTKPDPLVSSNILEQDFYGPNLIYYFNDIASLVVAMGATNFSYAMEEAKKIIELERKLAQIKTENKLNQMSVSELQTKYPGISWKTYLSKMTNIDNINDDDTVFFYGTEWLSKIFDILSITPQRTLVSYVQFRAIAELLSAVGLRFMHNIDSKPDQHCRELIKDKLSIALSALYVRKYVPKTIKQQMTELVGNVKSSFLSLIHANEWVDDVTKDAAIKKIEHLYDLVAYPEELLDDEIVDKYYEPVEYKENFLELFLSISKSINNAKYSKFRTVPKRDEWERYASVTDNLIYYNFYENAIQILAGFISNPFYNPNFPNYMNYASMGFTVARTINYGLSGAGLGYDENGLRRSWVSDQALAKLNERINCLRSQYVQKHHDEAMARRTSREDQVDATGIVAGYLAYQSWIQSHSDEGRLPSLSKYTPNQLFWISFGRLWCEIASEDYLNNVLTTNEYSREMYRVQVSLMNSEEFSKDFKCPSGSKMNPVKKCKIWN